MPPHPAPDIHYLERSQVDDDQWNACLAHASNGLVYAQTQFLDALCPGWGALVQGNYQAIMPLPQRKKWGIAYLYQPFQTPVLGIFGAAAALPTDDFLQAIPTAFRLWDLSLNPANPTKQFARHVIARQNFVLRLNTDYDTLRTQYHSQLKRSLQKAKRAGLVVQQPIAVDAVLALARLQYPTFSKAQPADFDRIAGLCRALPQQVSSWGVYNQQGSLLASAIFLHHCNRAYYWLVGNNPSGRQTGASALLLDAFIRRHAGTGMVLDFEGSDVPGVAAFYSSFGAVNEPYHTLYYNRLPFPFSQLKKMPAHYRQILGNQQG